MLVDKISPPPWPSYSPGNKQDLTRQPGQDTSHIPSSQLHIYLALIIFICIEIQKDVIFPDSLTSPLSPL